MRQAESLAQEALKPVSNQRQFKKGEKDADTRSLEKLLSDTTGLTVTIDHKGQGGTVFHPVQVA